ncbi:ATP-binding protein [Sinirhodobacter sp. WL0062]|uniref:histidine kinase n=1 Tax=Rhodobacter flavimaris TaxID=2907145 RepID=A0ABS8YV95_9RHOB|nr:ATP-binding protein [Sinirhodobacter sp. WL0062]MCE5973771.1 ATP-binding protein [Sinirhodobacter sp. WL0062]
MTAGAATGGGLSRLRRVPAALSVLTICCVAVLAGALAWRAAIADIDARLQQSLILSLRALETEIDRFRYLPKVTGEDARIRDAILHPEDPSVIDAANRYLQRVTGLAGASHLYLMDGAGQTLAASNWDTGESFVGNNYSFRPYFREAIENGAGGFYAIGVTTGTPGYFLAARIDLDAGKQGVVVVKVVLDPLEEAWRAAGQANAVADVDGIVFLSGEPAWRYQPLEPLSPEAVARLTSQRTYYGAEVRVDEPLLHGAQGWIFDGAGSRLRTQSAPFGPDWRMISAAPVLPAIFAALGWGAGAALCWGLGIGMAKIQRQRRQLVALRLRQSELLERKVEERTRMLAREIEARRQTEAELRAAQESLIHTEKMAALGRMSAAIVHEVSQPLAAMEATLAAAELSLERTPERTGPRIETARNLIRRMQRTIKHLKSFSRKESGTLDEIDPVQVAESALELVQPRARAVGVVPDLTVEGAPIRVKAGRVRLEQVLLNLLLNALDAVEGLPRREVRLIVATHGAEVHLSVEDTGTGIAPEDLPRVTEPFFSTKTNSEGLGLGLAISQAILSEFGGRFEVHSVPGEGTRMTAILPLIEEARA